MEHSNQHQHESHHTHDHHAEHAESGHNKHVVLNVADFWKRFIVCSIVSIPVFALPCMIQQWLGFEVAFVNDKYMLAVPISLSTIVVAINAQLLKRKLP